MNCDRHTEVVAELKEHDNRISKLELENIGFSKDIKNLCEKIDILVKNLDGYSASVSWAVKLIIGAIVAGAIGLLFK